MNISLRTDGRNGILEMDRKKNRKVPITRQGTGTKQTYNKRQGQGQNKHITKDRDKTNT